MIATTPNSITTVSVAILRYSYLNMKLLIYLKWYSLHDFNKNIFNFMKNSRLIVVHSKLSSELYKKPFGMSKRGIMALIL